VRRRCATWVCLVAAVVTFGALPGLHAIVHAIGSEAPAPRHERPSRGRVEASRGDRERAAKRQHAPAPRRDRPHRHEHAPGFASAEHLQLTFAASAPPMIPPAPSRAVNLEPPAWRDRTVDAAPAAAHPIRGPPLG
jgi:hypothetical protein